MKSLSVSERVLRRAQFNPLSVGPRRLRYRGVTTPMTRSRASADDVPSGPAANYCGKRAGTGFDDVESIAASGYLLDQFLFWETNHPADRYCGSLQNRARFTL